MNRLLILFVLGGGLFIASVGCGGRSENTVVESPTVEYEDPTEDAVEANQEEYEKAMSGQ